MADDDDAIDQTHDEQLPPPRATTPDDPTESVQIVSASDEPPLRFGPDDTGPLPHWTEPPTGEVPRIFAEEASSDDLSAWSSITQSPVWRDDKVGDYGDDSLDFAPLADGTRLGALDERIPDEDPFFADPGVPPAEPSEPARVTPIRTRRTLGGGATATRRAQGEDGFTANRGTGGRDMGTAALVGVVIAAVALLLLKAGERYEVALIAVIVGLAAVEFYEKLRERGYQPATLVGILAIAGLPLAAYWRGESAVPFVVALAAATTVVWFLFSSGVESGPLPNTAITMLGVVYIGFLASYAALILNLPNGAGTFITLAAGVVAYDVGGLMIGSSTGRNQLVPWVSPNKTVEGLLGGCLCAVLVVVILHFGGLGPWDDSFGKSLLLGLVVAITAPLGDLMASMFKRNLEVKDFGTLLPGHGGVLDRFCSFLFVLPAVYYLCRVVDVF